MSKEEFNPIEAQMGILNKLGELRAPFPAHQISKLPRQTKAQKDALDRDNKLGIRCGICGGWHHKDAIHLDYVGHAALTDRLLDVDPFWNWEPLSLGQNGLPALDHDGGLWIKLTVCGMSRLGYGDAQGKSGGDAMKERIGDALRNAAMRFGAALDLWHKGDLHVEEGQDGKPKDAVTGADEKHKRESSKTVAQGEFDALDSETQEWMRSEAATVILLLSKGDTEGAVSHLSSLNLDNDGKTAIWALFDSKQRRAMKEYQEANK